MSGALYVEDFRRAARAAGFEYPVALAGAPIEIRDPGMRKLLGPARFFSITYRLFKLPGMLESICEDYGQVATYKGTIPGHEGAYTLDAGHTLEAGRPLRVCGNTAAMLGEGGVSWLAPHFEAREEEKGGWGGPPDATKAGRLRAGTGPCRAAPTPTRPPRPQLTPQVTGDRSHHFGIFGGGPPADCLAGASASAAGGGGGGGCC